jgi:hypothetical protein
VIGLDRGGTVETSIEVEAQGDHQYLVRLRGGDDVNESWFTVPPEVLDRLHVGSGDEEGLVRRTAEFLAGHQDVADYPTLVDLEDVIATYADYLDVVAG